VPDPQDGPVHGGVPAAIVCAVAARRAPVSHVVDLLKIHQGHNVLKNIMKIEMVKPCK
jgi:hypothetical protein